MPELSPEDQKKVDRYLNREGGDQRKPFSPLLLLVVVLIVLALITLASYLIAQSHGVI